MSASIRFELYPHLNAIGKMLQLGHLGPFVNKKRPKRVERMRDDFLDAASHELKTPLTSLMLQMQLIPRFTDSPDKLKYLAEDASRQISRMTEVINSLLDASGMSAGKLELRHEVFDLAELVQEVVYGFKADPAHAGLEIRINAPQVVPGRWDRARITQTVKSLLSNAAIYGMKRPIEISVWADRSHARVSVRDQGLGISEADQERIFNQFERAVPSEKFNGLGLGLYIARQIALAHKGEIQVDSREGEGSVFTLRLPLSLAQRARAAVPRRSVA